MATNQNTRLTWTGKLGAFSLSLLSYCSPALAHGHAAGSPEHLHRQHDRRIPGLDRAELRIARQAAAAARMPGDALTRTFDNHRVGMTRTLFLNDRGNLNNIRRGVSLDLASVEANITIGSKTLGNSSVTIQEGGQTKTFFAGSTATAAEYAALNQKLSTGDQGLTLDSRGAATSGALNLNVVNDNGRSIRASELVIPTGVIVTGDMARTADGIRVTGDLTNYGSLVATSSNAARQTASIGARDINNELSGSISSTNGLNLSLIAARDLNNEGLIVSSGDLSLSAGSSVNNRGEARAGGSLLVQAANINNQGLLSSQNQNVTLSASNDSNLTVNNVGGTIGALNGSINVRESGYDGTANSTVTGGDLLSKTLNIHAGKGVGNVFVNQLTGVVNSAGEAVHVGADTDDLVIGQQCLTGDPTYYNTGNIILGGNIIVGEDLAIIAGGNITTNQSSLQITAQSAGGQGFDIALIAGANVTAGSGEISPAGGPAILPGQPPTTQNATLPVTFNTNSTNGGNVDLTGASTSLVISASSTSANLAGGDVTLAAFSGVGGGKVLLPTNSVIDANGMGSGTSGKVTVAAGGTSGTTIQLGSISNNGGTGSGTISISTAQPTTSDGKPITFATNGSISSGNFITPNLTAGGKQNAAAIAIGNISSVSNVSIFDGNGGTLGNTSAANITVEALNSVTTGDLTTPTGAINITDINHNVTINGTITTHDFKAVLVNVNSPALGGALTLPSNTLNVSGDVSGNGGSIEITAGSVVTPGSTLLLSAVGITGNGGSAKYTVTGGSAFAGTALVLGGVGSNLVIDTHGVLNGGTALVTSRGAVTLNPGGINAAGTDGNGASISLNAGLSAFAFLFINDKAVLQQADATGANHDGGTISLSGSQIKFVSDINNPLNLSANGTGTGNGGFIFYNPTATVGGVETTTVIGAPAVKVSAPVDFITLSAIGNNGGQINVSAAGDIVIDPSKANAGPTGVNGNGGSYIFRNINSVNKPGLNIIVAGSLNANGNGSGGGGTIFLDSDSAKGFSVGAGKLPKNGVMGTLQAIGTNGGITIQNRVGVFIANSAAIAANALAIGTESKGKLTTGKGTVLSFAKNMSLVTGIKGITVSTPDLRVTDQNGAVSITNLFTGPTFLQSSIGGKGFTYTGSGPTTMFGISTTKGSIKVTSTLTNGGLLEVANNAKLTANGGSLSLINLDTTNGSIRIGQNATVQTLQKGKAVVIAIGPAVKKGTNPVPPGTAPAGFTVIPVGKGVAFFGPGGVVSNGGVKVNVINQNVIFNNLSTGGKLITADTNATITADPPTPVRSAAQYTIAAPPATPASSDLVAPVVPVQIENTAPSIDPSQLTVNTLNVQAISNGLQNTEQNQVLLTSVRNARSRARFR